VPSFDLRARGFDPRRYWRGPIWINTDWLLWRGLTSHGRTRLADEIAASMVGLVRRSGWREYFSPFGGRGFGSILHGLAPPGVTRTPNHREPTNATRSSAEARRSRGPRGLP
jgi:glycogen debranching enzyme